MPFEFKLIIIIGLIAGIAGYIEKKSVIKHRSVAFLLVCVVAYLGGYLGYSARDCVPMDTAASPKPITGRTLVRAIDGDTIELDGGERVRILCINTPETWKKIGNKFVKIKSPDPRGIKAFEYVRSFEGQGVRLTYDKRKTDRYGRTLAHVYVIDSDVDLGSTLIKKGWADVMVIPPNMSRYQDYKHLKAELVAQ